jgi:prolipoprotein diacylglyceryltransferase
MYAALGLAEVGCLFAGCLVGHHTTGPFALRFPDDSATWHTNVASGLISENAQWSLPTHPLPLYLALVNFAVAAALIISERWGYRPSVSRISWSVAAQSAGAWMVSRMRDPSAGSPQPYSGETHFLIMVIAAGLAAGLAWLRGPADGKRRAAVP